MNYDQPRQIAEGPHAGKWQYTSANRRTGTHPIGFCWAPGPDSDPYDAATWPMHYHDTEAEARECYAEYQRSKVYISDGWSWAGCNYPECGNPANQAAQIGGDGYRIAMLCPDHNNTPDAITALGLNKPAGDSMHS